MMSYQNNPYKRKQTAQREIRKLLILCEGGKTEPNYFNAFQWNGELINVKAFGTGENKDSLVEHAISLKKEAERINIPYAWVWCVFDRDLCPENPKDKNNFIRAIQLAKNNQIRVAYSNDAFELWYVLHFHPHEAAWRRNMYEDKLTKLLGSKYIKNDQGMYDKLKDKQPIAIKNAKRLLEKYLPNHNPESDNPCTTVHKLVQFLNDYLKNEE